MRILGVPAAALRVSAWATAMLSGATDSLAVTAVDSAGKPTAVPDNLTFRSSNSAVAAVDAAGRITAVGVGQATISASAPPGPTVYGTSPITETWGVTVVPTGPFRIDVRFVGPGFGGAAGAQVQRAMARAAERWRALVSQGGAPYPVNLPAGLCGPHPAMSEVVQSLVVYVTLETFPVFDIAVARAGPCVVRTGNTEGTMYGLPAVGRVQVDTSRAVRGGEDLLASIMVHEIGHVLGFGTRWDAPGLLSGTCTNDPRFTGANARAASLLVGGSRIPGFGVPLDNVAQHWRASTLAGELMTPGASALGRNSPVSVVTLGSLADLGYLVVPAATDPFQIAPSASASVLRITRDDGDTPLQPILAVEPNGRVRHITAADSRARLAVPRILTPPARVRSKPAP